MRCLTRYVIGQVTIRFLGTALTLTLLLLVVGAAKEAISEGLGFAAFFRLVPYLVPNGLLFAIPGAILFAVSQVYGRMSSDNEFVAVKSLGIHPWILIWPTLVVAALLSLMTVWINDLAVSWGYRGAQKLILEAVEDIAYRTLSARHSFSTRAFSVQVARVEGKKLIDATFTFQPKGDSAGRTVTAAEAEFATDPEQGLLNIAFTDANIDAGDTQLRIPGTIEYQLSLDQVSRKGNSLESPAHMALAEISGQATGQAQRIADLRRQMAAQAAETMLSGNFSALGTATWREQRQRLESEELQTIRLSLEAPRRWANGFSCLCFSLVGIPVAIRLKNREFLTSFFLCFLPVLLCYYPLMMFAIDRAKAGELPIYLIWLPNLAFAAWSLLLFRKVLRH